MARCRIGYLLALVGAAAFFLCFNGYFSFYILVLALVFPLFSLLISLPGMLGAGVSFAADQRAIRRGGSVKLTIELTNRFKLPVGQVTARFACVNRLTGDVLAFRKKGYGGSLGLDLVCEVEAHHCGAVECAVTRLKVCDLLGLFSRSLSLPTPITVLSLPMALPPEEVPILLGEGEQQVAMKPRPGGGPGEDYDLRPYRAGDPLRSVHWKLSSKMDGLIVRETLEPVKVQAVLTYDHFGTPEELDLVFDRLDAVSRALIERERSHSIHWRDPASGAVCTKTVSGQNDLRAFEHAAFSTPAPKEGRSIRAAVSHRDGPAQLLRQFHVEAAREGGGEG